MGAGLTPRGRSPAGRPVRRGAPSPKAAAGRAAPQGAFRQVTSDRNRGVSPRANIAAPRSAAAARARPEHGTPKPTADARESRPNGGSEFKPDPVSERPAIVGGAAATCWAPFRPCPRAARRYSRQRRAAPARAPVRAPPAAACRPGPLATRVSAAPARPGGMKNPALPASPGPAAPGRSPCRPPPTKGRGLSRRLRPARVGPLGGARPISARGRPAAAARPTGGKRPGRGLRAVHEFARPGRDAGPRWAHGEAPSQLGSAPRPGCLHLQADRQSLTAAGTPLPRGERPWGGAGSGAARSSVPHRTGD